MDKWTLLYTAHNPPEKPVLNTDGQLDLQIDRHSYRVVAYKTGDSQCNLRQITLIDLSMKVGVDKSFFVVKANKRGEDNSTGWRLVVKLGIDIRQLIAVGWCVDATQKGGKLTQRRRRCVGTSSL